MAVVINKSNGKKITLLNPAEKARKFAKELKQNFKRTNSGQYKIDENKKAIRLTNEERAFRSGYLSARSDSARCFKAKKK